MEAGDPEESAAEEKEVEEKEGERKAERIGSLANASKGDELVVVVVVADVVIAGLFKLERRWRGEVSAAGEAISASTVSYWCVSCF